MISSMNSSSSSWFLPSLWVMTMLMMTTFAVEDSIPSRTLPPTPTPTPTPGWMSRLCLVFGIWLFIEVIFAIVFYKIFIPKLQPLQPPAEYRDYAPTNRCQLFNRILQRLEAVCHTTNSPVIPFIKQYVRQWFHPILIKDEDQKNNNDNDNDDDELVYNFWPHKDDMDDFISWAFFSTSFDNTTMEDWMISEMEEMYKILQIRYDITFQPGRATNPSIQPMRVTLDPLEPKYRPFFIYGFFRILKFIANIILYGTGFQYYTTSTGLTYWYRSGRQRWQEQQQQLKQHRRPSPNTIKSTSPSSSSSSTPTDNSQQVTTTITHDNNNTTTTTTNAGLPLLFLHGIAPGGLALYLPMLFFLGQDGRPLFLFENPSISFGIQFWMSPSQPLAEQETTIGIWEAVHQRLGRVGGSIGSGNEASSVRSSDSSRPYNHEYDDGIAVSVVGHSFGSCPITWLIHSEYAHYIRQVVLIDPVSILLHEPDVVTNFLYKAKLATKGKTSTISPSSSSSSSSGQVTAAVSKVMPPQQVPSSSSSSSISPQTTGSLSATKNNNNNNNKTLEKKPSNVGIVSNELFTEHYLRRHFAWYNSELWLEDIPAHIKVLVCLSEQDQLVSAHKVQRELNRVILMKKATRTGNEEGKTTTTTTTDVVDDTNTTKGAKLPSPSEDSSSSSTTTTVVPSSSSSSDATTTATSTLSSNTNNNIEVMVWEEADHAHCLTRPQTWRQMLLVMKRQEQLISTEQLLLLEEESSSSSSSLLSPPSSKPSHNHNQQHQYQPLQRDKNTLRPPTKEGKKTL